MTTQHDPLSVQKRSAERERRYLFSTYDTRPPLELLDRVSSIMGNRELGDAASRLETALKILTGYLVALRVCQVAVTCCEGCGEIFGAEIVDGRQSEMPTARKLEIVRCGACGFRPDLTQ